MWVLSVWEDYKWTDARSCLEFDGKSGHWRIVGKIWNWNSKGNSRTRKRNPGSGVWLDGRQIWAILLVAIFALTFLALYSPALHFLIPKFLFLNALLHISWKLFKDPPVNNFRKFFFRNFKILTPEMNSTGQKTILRLHFLGV